MPEVTFRHGDPIMADYTPTGGNVNAGTVVLLGNTIDLTCGVIHVDLENNRLGAVAVGGGVYEGVNLNNAAENAEVWWDNATKKFTTTSTNNARFGFVTD